jgi:two-component system chemotaxis sensor kinase CheA
VSDSYRETYREEALELLADLEVSLLELEKVPENMELVSRIFRALHTIKGSGAMFGFDNIATFVHDIESVYDRIRNNKMPITKDIINATLKAKDQIRLMLDEPLSEEVPLNKPSEKFIDALHQSTSVVKETSYVSDLTPQNRSRC